MYRFPLLPSGAGVSFLSVLGDVGGGSVLARHPQTSDAKGKHLGTRRFGADAPILTAVIVAAPAGSVIFGDRPLLVVVVVLVAMGIDGVTYIAVLSELLFDRSVPTSSIVGTRVRMGVSPLWPVVAWTAPS